MKIAIYGAGGFGKEVACLIERINRNGGDWQLVGFFDDSKKPDSHISRYGKVLGDMETLLSVDEPLALAIAINENKFVRRRIRERIDNPNISFPNLIDPSLFLVDPETFTIGEGNIIQNHCMISCDVKIGSFIEFTSPFPYEFTTIALGSWTPHGRTFRTIEHTKLDGCGISDQSHLSSHGINLTHNLSFGNTTDGRIARHLCNLVHVHGYQTGLCAHVGSSASRFTTGVSSSND